jgi:hypothetical protein
VGSNPNKVGFWQLFYDKENSNQFSDIGFVASRGGIYALAVLVARQGS